MIYYVPIFLPYVGDFCLLLHLFRPRNRSSLAGNREVVAGEFPRRDGSTRFAVEDYIQGNCSLIGASEKVGRLLHVLNHMDSRV